MQYRGDLAAEWASYGPDAETIAGAFVRGINAWVSMTAARVPEEFRLAGWTPEPWRAEDLLNRTDAFVASGDAALEIVRARLVAAVGERQASDLLRVGRSIEVPRGLDAAGIHYVVLDALRRVGTPPFFSGLAAPVGGVPLEADSSGRRSKIDAADVLKTRVTTYRNPSPRYLVHLNAPGWNVVGATSPWLPGVAVGHNDRLAWDVAPLDADTQDIFVERVNPENAHQVEIGGRWVDTTIVKDPIVIKGRASPFDFEVELTPHGVIIASDREHNLAFTVRWSGMEPGAAGELAALALDRARDVAEGSDALRRWKMPAVTVTLRDVDGNITRRARSLVPVREGWSGALPAPGWTGRYEWRGWRNAGEVTRDTSRPGPEAPLLRQTGGNPEVLQAKAQLSGWLRTHGGEEPDAAAAVTFTHPLAVTAAARHRFDIGPLPTLAKPEAPVRIVVDVADWDRSVAMNAPGQSGSPGSAHFADLAELWAAGKDCPLAFSGAAVAEHTESTLVLTPRVRKR